MSRLLIAALSLAAVTLSASPALAGPVSLKLDGIDTTTTAGKAELGQRIHRAAGDYCRNQTVTGTRLIDPACVVAVEQELREKVAVRTTANRVASNR